MPSQDIDLSAVLEKELEREIDRHHEEQEKYALELAKFTRLALS